MRAATDGTRGILDDMDLAEFDLRQLPPEFYADPYPLYRRLQAQSPVHPLPDGSWFLTRHADLDRIYRDTTSTGPDFTAQLKDLITANQADMVFVDPLLSFAGIDVSDQEQASRFLRHDLAPILLETGAVLVAMHHTGKPKSAADKEGQTVADLAYAGLGSSEFTNYFREVAVLFRCQGDQPVYKFGLTKRRGRAGLQNADQDFAGEILIRHSRQQGVIRWEYAVPEESQPVHQTPRQSSVKGSPRRSDG